MLRVNFPQFILPILLCTQRSQSILWTQINQLSKPSLVLRIRPALLTTNRRMVLKIIWITPRAAEYRKCQFIFLHSLLLLRFKQHLFCPLSKTLTGKIKNRQKLKKKKNPSPICAGSNCGPGLCARFGVFLYCVPRGSWCLRKTPVKYPGTTCMNSSQTQSPGLVWMYC